MRGARDDRGANAGRGCPGGGPGGAGRVIARSGLPAVAQMLTIVRWQSSQGDGAGDRSPRPEAGTTAGLAKGTATGQVTTRATATTSQARADLSSAGGPGPVGREWQGSLGRQSSRGQLSRPVVPPTPAGKETDRARMT